MPKNNPAAGRTPAGLHLSKPLPNNPLRFPLSSPITEDPVTPSYIPADSLENLFESLEEIPVRQNPSKHDMNKSRTRDKKPTPRQVRRSKVNVVQPNNRIRREANTLEPEDGGRHEKKPRPELSLVTDFSKKPSRNEAKIADQRHGRQPGKNIEPHSPKNSGPGFVDLKDLKSLSQPKDQRPARKEKGKFGIFRPLWKKRAVVRKSQVLAQKPKPGRVNKRISMRNISQPEPVLTPRKLMLQELHPITIGLSVPADSPAASGNNRSGETQGLKQDKLNSAEVQQSQPTPITPTIIVTPAEQDHNMWTDRRPDPRPTSSIYSRASTFAKGPPRVDSIPPVPALPKPEEYSKTLGFENPFAEKSSLGIHPKKQRAMSISTTFEDSPSIPQKPDKSVRRSRSFSDLNTPDVTPPRLSFDVLSQRRLSHGWWNYIWLPMNSRRGTAIFDRERSPRLPPLASVIHSPAGRSNNGDQMKGETPVFSPFTPGSGGEREYNSPDQASGYPPSYTNHSDHITSPMSAATSQSVPFGIGSPYISTRQPSSAGGSFAYGSNQSPHHLSPDSARGYPNSPGYGSNPGGDGGYFSQHRTPLFQRFVNSLRKNNSTGGRSRAGSDITTFDDEHGLSPHEYEATPMSIRSGVSPNVVDNSRASPMPGSNMSRQESYAGSAPMTGAGSRIMSPEASNVESYQPSVYAGSVPMSGAGSRMMSPLAPENASYQSDVRGGSVPMPGAGSAVMSPQGSNGGGSYQPTVPGSAYNSGPGSAVMSPQASNGGSYQPSIPGTAPMSQGGSAIMSPQGSDTRSYQGSGILSGAGSLNEMSRQSSFGGQGSEPVSAQGSNVVSRLPSLLESLNEGSGMLSPDGSDALSRHSSFEQPESAPLSRAGSSVLSPGMNGGSYQPSVQGSVYMSQSGSAVQSPGLVDMSHQSSAVMSRSGSAILTTGSGDMSRQSSFEGQQSDMLSTEGSNIPSASGSAMQSPYGSNAMSRSGSTVLSPQDSNLLSPQYSATGSNGMSRSGSGLMSPQSAAMSKSGSTLLSRQGSYASSSGRPDGSRGVSTFSSIHQRSNTITPIPEDPDSEFEDASVPGSVILTIPPTPGRSNVLTPEIDDYPGSEMIAQSFLGSGSASALPSYQHTPNEPSLRSDISLGSKSGNISGAGSKPITPFMESLRPSYAASRAGSRGESFADQPSAISSVPRSHDGSKITSYFQSQRPSYAASRMESRGESVVDQLSATSSTPRSQDGSKVRSYFPSFINTERFNYPEPLSPGAQTLHSVNSGIPLSAVASTHLSAFVSPRALSSNGSFGSRRSSLDSQSQKPKGGMLSNDDEPKKRKCFGFLGKNNPNRPQDPKSKRRRRVIIIILILMFLCVIGVCVLLAVLLTNNKNKDEPELKPWGWLNLTGYPPMPTGVTTVAGPNVAADRPGCVASSSMWSCALPKELHLANAPYEADQPRFKIEIKFQNGTSGMTLIEEGNASRALEGESPPKVDKRGLTPDPKPPTLQELWFMGNTTDNISIPHEGEQTPFFVDILQSLEPSSNKGPGSSSRRSLMRRDDESDFPDLNSIVPAPSLDSDGTAAAANLYPLPKSQPVRLYDRDLPTEHYGFYTYFDRSIFLKSSRPLGNGNETVDLPDDSNGGSSKSAARARCTWTQTRLLVQIWTRPSQGKMQLLPPSEGRTSATPTASSTATPSPTIDFDRPGSLPYPVTITLDRHGGDPKKKLIYCYGMDVDGKILEDKKKLQLEHRGFAGTIINPAPGIFNVSSDTSDEKRAENPKESDIVGFDGGSGGCRCEWRNWLSSET
ncbi:hypothetical protein FQN57_001200 [Myotisia sp. PD_48]|nr:hypothetical protein FQN57_001200 [Myotisia sp. PD_48]